MDTSGIVRVLESDTGGEKTIALYKWHNLSPFVQGYVRALLRDAPSVGALSNLRFAGFSDLAPAALAEILKDCERYIATFQARTRREVHASDRYGRAFWKARNASQVAAFPPLTITLADDGKIHLRTRDE